MKISQNIDLIRPAIEQERLIFGWCTVVALSTIEFLALTYGKPSTLKLWPPIEALVTWTANWIPTVRSFGHCAARIDVGTGLMLTLNAIFFIPKLAAIFFAHPKKLLNPDRGLRAVWGSLYMFMIGLVCLVPTYVFYILWGDLSVEIELTSIRLKMSALCLGGPRAFLVGIIQSGFALAGAYGSLVILSSLLRNFIRSTAR